MKNQSIVILADKQQMLCYEQGELRHIYSISTGKNGLGELKNSECTPRGKHRVHRIIGLDNQVNSVFVARKWTGEIYTLELQNQYPERDWILTRILQLDGLEPGKNKDGNVDSLERCIYIHGTPDSVKLGIPGSKGCVRMRNSDIIDLADWICVDAVVDII